MKVLVLGADGFIGRHIAFHLRDQGHRVLAQARSTGRLAAMGFATLRADLTDPASHDPAFWAPHLEDGALVIAAGLLTGSEAAFRAVHLAAPRAAIAAGRGPVVLVSAAGIDSAATAFARWRRAAEDMAQDMAADRAVILRPGLVLGDTSYGGSSLIRALAALPLALPVVGDGAQVFNPIHAADLAAVIGDCLARAADRGEAGYGETGRPEADRWETGHAERGHAERGHAERGRPEAGHWETGRAETDQWATSGRETRREETGRKEMGRKEMGRKEAGHGETARRETGHRDAGHRDAGRWATGRWEIGGPEDVTQAALIGRTRAWLGLRPVPVLPIPLAVARLLGRLGDALRLGPISATAVAQLQAGVRADPARFPPLAVRPRGFGAFLAARPAGTQDLWQARLYLLKPLIRLVLAVLWLASAGLGLFLPLHAFAGQVALLPEPLALLLARGGGLADLALGLLLLRNIAPRRVALAQLLLVGGYTAGLTLIAPALWADPFGGLLKNLPVLALILVHLALVEER